MENCKCFNSISVSINTDCNGNCPYCFQQNYHGQHKYMTLEEFKRILDWAGDLDQVKLLGGEPTLHPEFLDFVNELTTRNVHASILTNASTHNPELWEKLIETDASYLVNCNHNHKLDDIFMDNLKILFKNNGKKNITLGITLLGDDSYDNDSIEYLNYLIHYFSNASIYIRVGIATPYAGEYKIINYSKYINRLMDIIEGTLCTLGIDCQINCCNIDFKTFGRMLYNDKVQPPKLEPCPSAICAVRLDGSVLYCDSLEDIKIDHYSECKSLDECKTILKEKKDAMIANLSIDSLCNNGTLCSNPICSGPCPAILNKLKKQSLEVYDG